MFILSISQTLSPGEFLENAPWCLKIDNFKLGQIEKIVRFSERGSLTENNGSITSAQLLIVMEKFKFFKNFKNEIANVIFRTIFNESEIFFDRSRKSNAVFRFGICIILRAKMSPTPSLKSSGLPRYNHLIQISCC